MKNIGLVCLLLVSICCGLQAKKIVKVPYFMACNTRSIEVEQVTLGKDTTWLAVRLYGMQGDRVRIDSTAVLRASGKDYGYLGNTGFARDEWTHIPASGGMTAVLKFSPLPMDTESFEFMVYSSTERNLGWIFPNVCGIRNRMRFCHCPDRN